MSLTLCERLRAVEVIDARQAGRMQVFSLRWAAVTGPDYLTLDEALAAGSLDVTEVSEGGTVPLLKVANRGTVAVFLMAGEQLVGAKQNRVLNTSILVPAASEVVIPVSCVEAGRWGYRSAKFGSAGTLSHGKLRKLMSSHVYESYTDCGTATSKQGEVWAEVSRKLDHMGTVSPSAALQQTYEDHETRLKDVLGELTPPEGACGVAFVLGGRIAGADLFDRPSTLTRLWPKVTRAYAIDGLEEEDEADTAVLPDLVADWLRSAGQAEAQIHKSPGLGFDVRLRDARMVGGGLVVDDQPVHAELFAL